MIRQSIGVLGATSLVGECLLAPEFAECMDADEEFVAFSRRAMTAGPNSNPRVSWRRLQEKMPQWGMPIIENWICLVPVWVLPDYYSFLEACGVRRVVVLSSTSRFTKIDSSDPYEQGVVASLISGENQLVNWAEKRGIVWIILRPTLIYGFGRDKNISSIARFIRRFGFFPLLGAASGLRQPIHACDVATACCQALMCPDVVNRAYNISGGETVAYHEMVRRVFYALGRKPRFLTIPQAMFRSMRSLSRLLPGFADVSMEIVERMNRDLVFDHGEALRDFAFEPGIFSLHRSDVA